MKTVQDRREHLIRILSDPDLQLSVKEAIVYVYNWTRYELALQKRASAMRSLKKYCEKLNQDTDVYRLRKHIRNL